MRIIGTQFTLRTKAYELYLSGCKASPHCKNCHNPESWDFELGELLDIAHLSKIKKQILSYGSLIDNIMLFGGEPLDQNPEELDELLSSLLELDKKIWIFTRYSLSEIPDFVKEKCDYLKCGRYEESLKCEDNIQYGIKLATSNQIIYKKGKDF